MKRFTILSISAAFLLLSALPAAAETELLDEIVVKGAKESPQQESLTIREVRESPARDIGEALKQVEGINIVRKGAIANDPVLRGFQKDNINVLVDGVRLHGACPSRMDPPSFHYDFAEVEQIRITKGPYDLENPGGLGGLIEVLTKRPKQGFGSELGLTYGSYDSFNASGTVSYGGEQLDGLAGYAYKRSGVPKSGNGKLITDIYPPTSPNRYRPDAIDSKAYEINTGWFKLGLNPTPDARSELSYTYQDAEHVLYPYLKMDADYDRTHRLNWNYRKENLTPLVRELKLQAYWDRVEHLMNDSLRASSFPSAVVTRTYSMQTDARTQVAGAKLSMSLAVGPGTWKNGADYYNRNWDAENQRAMYTMARPYTTLNMIPGVSVDNYGMFSEYELPVASTLTVKGGIRGDLTRIKAEKSNGATAISNGTSFGQASANVQATWKPLAGLELFTGLGRGTRTPDPEELYISVPAAPPAVSWRGNPNLNPTVNHQADLGVKYSSDRYYVSGSVFYSDLHDFINFYSESATVKSYQNIDATMWGSEFSGQFSLPFDLYLKGSLSYTEARNKDGDRPLSEIPPLKGLVAVRYDNGVWFCEVTENMAARQDRVDSALNEQPTAGWATTDLKAGVNIDSWRIYAGVYNLFDKQYYSNLSYLRDPFSSGVGVKVPENGRNFYVTATYEF